MRDQGPGVPECAEGEVFEKIYSLPLPNSRKCRTGLGLAFVKEIVGLHGGGWRGTTPSRAVRWPPCCCRWCADIIYGFLCRVSDVTGRLGLAG